MIEFEFIISAFVAGLLTFLAPCTLPLVPAYLGFISGVDVTQLNQVQAEASALRRKIIWNGFWFVLGFSLVFILMGILVGVLGQAFIGFREIATRIGGVFVIAFGLFMLGVFKLSFLQIERQISLPAFFTKGQALSSLLIGVAFGLGWSPCIGPILASILILASSTGTALTGAALLAIFSLGLAVPFMTTAFLVSRAMRSFGKIARYTRITSIIGGIFLVGLGLLLLLDEFSLLVEYGYRALKFINYDGLLSHF